MKASSQIGLVRVGVGRVALCDLLLLIAGQSQAELVGDLSGNVLFHCKYVGSLPVILLAPELRPRRCIDQIHLNVQRVAHLAHASHQHCAHVKFTSDLLRIHLLSLVAEGGSARSDPQPLKLRKAVDQALADAVGNIFHVRIAARVRERQYRD